MNQRLLVEARSNSGLVTNREELPIEDQRESAVDTLPGVGDCNLHVGIDAKLEREIARVSDGPILGDWVRSVCRRAIAQSDAQSPADTPSEGERDD